jgi:sugar phosphate isomerase/epimerase
MHEKIFRQAMKPVERTLTRKKRKGLMTSRRKFIAAAGAAAALGFADSALPRLAWGNPMGLPIGIQLYTVRQTLQADPAGTLNKLHAIGFREVETAGFAGKSAKEFRRLIDGAGLSCPSAHLNFDTTDLSPVFADAHDLGAAYAVSSMLASSLHRQDPRSPLALDDFKKLAQLMNQIGRQAKAAGLQYAYHNHNVEFVKLPDGGYGYDLLLQETDRELVKFEIDCGWMTVAGADPITYFKRYPGRFRMIHVKDFQPVNHPVTSLSGPERPVGAELGRGYIQYERIFAAGKAAGIQHAFAEQEGPYVPSELAAAQADYDYLKKFS